MLKDYLESFQEAARKNFLSSGSLLPVFISEIDNKLTIMPLMWQDASDKDRFSFMLRSWISEGLVKEYIMINESWALRSVGENNISEASDWIREHGSLEHHPDRNEFVMIQYRSSDTEIDLFAEILRDNGVDLGEWSMDERSVSMANINPVDLLSRFNSMFVRSGSDLN